MSYVSRPIALVIFALTTACTESPRPSMRPDGGPDPTPTTVSARVCARLGSCNSLPGSVEECVQETDTGLKSLPENQRKEVELAFEDCLRHPSCDGFAVCLAAIFQ